MDPQAESELCQNWSNANSSNAVFYFSFKIHKPGTSTAVNGLSCLCEICISFEHNPVFCSGTGKAAEVLGPLPFMGDQHGIFGSWFQTGPDLAVAAIFEVNQKIKACSLSPRLFVYNFTFQTNKSFQKFQACLEIICKKAI